MKIDSRKITHYLPSEIVQAEYNHPRRLKGFETHDDNILVHLFDNEILFAGGGFHRLAIAKILQLESIPVDIGLIYKGR